MCGNQDIRYVSHGMVKVKLQITTLKIDSYQTHMQWDSQPGNLVELKLGH